MYCLQRGTEDQESLEWQSESDFLHMDFFFLGIPASSSMLNSLWGIQSKVDQLLHSHRSRSEPQHSASLEDDEQAGRELERVLYEGFLSR